jgi:hypothetical protein
MLRTLSSGTSRRGALGMLAGLAGLRLSEVAAKRRHQGGHRQGKGKAASQDKVTICHRTGSRKHPFQVITVPASAVPAHAAHGDLVDCPHLQAIDLKTCTCVCPVAAIDCKTGQQLDPETCTCVSPSSQCVPEECASQNTPCQSCSCGDDGVCQCETITCRNGAPCDPVTGCPVCAPGQCDSLNTACQTCRCNGGGCACKLVICETGPCDPVSGCPS